MRKRLLALMCAAVLLTSGAYAEMAVQADGTEAYVGENNQLFFAGALAPLETALVAELVGANGTEVYYLQLAGEFSYTDPTYTLKRADSGTLAVETIAENVTRAVFQPGENAVFYVAADEPSKIQAYPATVQGYEAGGEIEALKSSLQGLVITVGGTDSLFLPGIGVISLPAEEQGATYVRCSEEFEAIVSAEGALFVRRAGESEWAQLAGQATAVSYDEAGEMLYFVSLQDGKYSLYQYDPILRAASEVGIFMDIPTERMFAHGGVIYMITEEGALYGYTVATKAYVQVDSLQAYELSNPSLDYAGGSVLVYDRMMGMRLFVAAVPVEENAMPSPEPSANSANNDFVELSRGSEGEAVVRLQQRLIDLKYLVDEADGIFGPLTEEAVELLQADLGLEADGVADIDFQKTIFTTSIPTLELYATLRQGDEGTNVKKMQQRLRDKQYMASSADGIFGTRTAAAVKAYQEQNGFKVTGVADEAMLAHLYSSAAPTCNSYIELRDGDSGTMVKKLNARLRELYYTSATASSRYTSDTVAAVKLFQQQLGVTVTGVASVELQRQLFSEYAPQYAGYTDHFEGETDERILSAQLQLSSLGYLRPDALTGTLDALTAQAIRDFQYENALSVDGVLGVNTQTALFAANVSSAPSFLTAEQKNSMLGYVRTLLAGDWSDYDIISLIQQRLISLNYLSSKAETSGVYNRLTYEAVKRLQLDHALVDVSVSTAALGIADTKVIDVLMNPASTPYTGTPAYYYN